MKPPTLRVSTLAWVAALATLVACAHRPRPDAAAEAPSQAPEILEDSPPIDPGLHAPTPAHAFLQDFEGDFTTLFNELSGEEVGHAVTRVGPGLVHGVPCEATVHAYDDTWGCTLFEAHALDEHTQAAGSWIGLYYGSTQRRALVLESLVTPAESVTVADTECADFVHFHADGSLERCELSEGRDFAGTRYPAGSSIALRPDGSVYEAFVYETVMIGQTEVQPGYVALDPSGAVTSTSPEFFGD
ncbi:MAG: hypothetical protein KC912_11435 [Proteobacteria bacterium]|nr:hypothetical protein [Pseudomonadota bacterium]